MMQFRTSKSIKIEHGDGWGFTVNEYDDGMIQITYNETGRDQNECDVLSGICTDTARHIAAALNEIADSIEPPPKTTETWDSSDYQKGFQAGLAYVQYGDEATNAAKDSADSLRQAK